MNRDIANSEAASIEREMGRGGAGETPLPNKLLCASSARSLQNNSQHQALKIGFSLTELIAAIAIIGVLAMVIVPRLSSDQLSSKKSACCANQGDIELQVKLWKRNNGTYPAANLSDIGASTTYFPSGVPVCPVDGTAYTINTTTGLVNGHTH
jgi:prepilin-type N-terminal cleavage/methylation domain-containing protein